MREVSTRACEALLLGLAAERILPERLVAGLPVTVEQLADPHQWIDWDVFVELLERYEDLVPGLDAFERAGARLPVEPHLKANAEVSGVFPRLRQLYEHGGLLRTSLYYTHVLRQFEALGDGRFRVTFSIPERFTGCEAFFRLRAGSLQAIPALLGLPHARVEAEITSHRGVYYVTPPREPLLRRWRRVDRRAALDWCVDQLIEQARDLRAERERQRGGWRFDLVDTVTRLEDSLRSLLEPEVTLDLRFDVGVPGMALEPAELQPLLFETVAMAKRVVGTGALGVSIRSGDAPRSARVLVSGAGDGRSSPPDSARVEALRRRAQQLGADLHVRDEPGLGVVFELGLPQSPSAAA